jgi:hypothetical protein
MTGVRVRNLRWHSSDRLLGDAAFGIQLVPVRPRGAAKPVLMAPRSYWVLLRKILTRSRRAYGKKALFLLELAVNVRRLFGNHEGVAEIVLGAEQLQALFQQASRRAKESGHLKVRRAELVHPDGRVEVKRNLVLRSAQNLVFLNSRFPWKLLRHFAGVGPGSPAPLAVEICVAVEFAG